MWISNLAFDCAYTHNGCCHDENAIHFRSTIEGVLGRNNPLWDYPYMIFDQNHTQKRFQVKNDYAKLPNPWHIFDQLEKNYLSHLLLLDTWFSKYALLWTPAQHFSRHVNCNKHRNEEDVEKLRNHEFGGQTVWDPLFFSTTIRQNKRTST